MTPGQLAQGILYVALVAGSVGALAEVIGDIQRATGATERLLELYTAAPQITSPDRKRDTATQRRCKDAPLLLLDEATSALDAESEQAV